MGTRSEGGAYTTPTEWKLWNQTKVNICIIPAKFQNNCLFHVWSFPKLSQSQFERLTAERLDAESKRLRDDVGTRVTSSRREVRKEYLII